jgi:hypothetical protein
MAIIKTNVCGPSFVIKIVKITYYEMKIKKYTVPTIHRNKVGIVKFDILHTNKHDRSWLSRSISIKSDGVILVYSRFIFTALLL